MYAFIGDLHLGTKVPGEDYLKSLNKFFELIKKHKEECHCIFICGDLFDHRLNVDEASFAATFMAALVYNNCGRNGRQHVPVHFIHGTYSHDNEQYDIYMPLLCKLQNVEIFYTKTACSKKLENGAKVLYLPQEYGNIDYSKAFSNEYDIIVGHGPVASQTNHVCETAQYEILHSAEELGDISKICVFGHYHGYTDFGNNVYYTGPWLRWKYGEDTPRVFFFCNDKFEIETVPNDIATEYNTIEITSVDELRKHLSHEITNPHRFVIKCNQDELKDYHAIMNVNKNSFVKYKIISIKNNDTIKIDTNDTDDMDDIFTHAKVEPIDGLISYIIDKYGIDASEKIKAYEIEINKNTKDES